MAIVKSTQYVPDLVSPQNKLLKVIVQGILQNAQRISVVANKELKKRMFTTSTKKKGDEVKNYIILPSNFLDALKCGSFASFLAIASKHVGIIFNEDAKCPNIEATNEQEMFFSGYFYEVSRKDNQFSNFVTDTSPHGQGINQARYRLVKKQFLELYRTNATALRYKLNKKQELTEEQAKKINNFQVPDSMIKIDPKIRESIFSSKGTRQLRRILGSWFNADMGSADQLAEVIDFVTDLEYKGRASLHDFVVGYDKVWKSLYPTRTRTQEIEKKVKGKTVKEKVTTQVKLKPGKPWELPSVMPFERAAVKEMTNGPWTDLDKILHKTQLVKGQDGDDFEVVIEPRQDVEVEIDPDRWLHVRERLKNTMTQMQSCLKDFKNVTKSRLKVDGKILTAKDIASRYGTAMTLEQVKQRGVSSLSVSPISIFGPWKLGNGDTLLACLATQKGKVYIARNYPELKKLIDDFNSTFPEPGAKAPVKEDDKSKGKK